MSACRCPRAVRDERYVSSLVLRQLADGRSLLEWCNSFVDLTCADGINSIAGGRVSGGAGDREPVGDRVELIDEGGGARGLEGLKYRGYSWEGSPKI